MPTSLLSQVVEGVVKRLFHNSQHILAHVLVILIGGIYVLATGKNLRETIVIFVWVICGLVFLEICIAIAVIWLKLYREPKTEIVESTLYTPDLTKQRQSVPRASLPHYQIRLIGIGLLFFVILAALSYSVWALNSTEEKAVVLPPLPIVRQTPMLLVRYSLGSLPISIPTQESIYVLALSPAFTSGTQDIPNFQNIAFWWPEKPRPEGSIPLGDMYMCKLTNLNDKALLNVSLFFDISFYSVVKAKASAKEVNRQASSLSVELGGEDRASFAYYWKGNIVAGKLGSIISQHRHKAVIPSIAAHSSSTLYLVSQTNVFARFTLPSSATAIVDGFPDKQETVLVRPDMNVLDMLPYWNLTPSIYLWPSLPNSGIDLTKRQNDVDKSVAIKPKLSGRLPQ